MVRAPLATKQWVVTFSRPFFPVLRGTEAPLWLRHAWIHQSPTEIYPAFHSHRRGKEARKVGLRSSAMMFDASAFIYPVLSTMSILYAVFSADATGNRYDAVPAQLWTTSTKPSPDAALRIQVVCGCVWRLQLKLDRIGISRFGAFGFEWLIAFGWSRRCIYLCTVLYVHDDATYYKYMMKYCM